MRHVGDGVGFDDGLAIVIPPDLARIAVDRSLPTSAPRSRPCTSSHCLTISSALAGWTVRSALPCHTDSFGHGPLWSDAAAHEIAEFARRARRRLHHAAQRLADIAGDAERQAGNDGAGGKHFRIGGEHHRGHGAAGGQTGDEDAARVDAVIVDHLCDHLPDRSGFAAIARNVFRIEPVEAGVGVVGGALLRHQQRKAVALGQRRPAGADIVAISGLPAAMQHDDERGLARQIDRHVGKHLQRAGICAEFPHAHQRAARPVRLAAPVESEAVQLRNTAQEIDIVGERQKQLLSDGDSSASPTTDSCCSAK